MAADIVARSDQLLQEMGQLRERYFEVNGRNEHIPGLIVLMNSVKQERNSAQSSLASCSELLGNDGQDCDVQAAETRLRCSNVPAMETHWNIFKRCHHLISVETTISKFPRVKSNGKGGLQKVKAPQGQARGKGNKDLDSVYVHAIVDGGAEWLRIISKDEKRILMEMAEEGWDWEADEEDAIDQDVLEDIPLFRTAKDLAGAARNNWSNYHHPRIRIVCTRIAEGRNKEIDRLIQAMRCAGGDDITVTVDCADSEWDANNPPVEIKSAIANLVPGEDMSLLGDTVLLDTSVLIGLVSDASHSRVEKKPWHNEDLKAQIEDELNGISFLMSNAYPRLRGRKLVCTKEAVAHFEEITTTIGSPTERERARLLLDGGLEDLRRLSIHPIPDDLLLPVKVLVDQSTDLRADDLVHDGRLPSVAIQIEKHLLRVTGNRATHLYGWATGLTVVTSNRSLAKKLVRMVETSLTGDYETGPKICSLPYNRALATKGPGPKKILLLAQEGL